MTSKPVMVIGACGAIGRLLIRSLLEQGRPVIGVDRRRWRGDLPDGLDFCRIVPGSRDAPPEIVSASMVHLATEVRAAVA